MVVGHTVRAEGISSLCDGLAWRIDVGLAATESEAGRPGVEASQVLEVRTNAAFFSLQEFDSGSI